MIDDNELQELRKLFADRPQALALIDEVVRLRTVLDSVMSWAKVEVTGVDNLDPQGNLDEIYREAAKALEQTSAKPADGATPRELAAYRAGLSAVAGMMRKVGTEGPAFKWLSDAVTDKMAEWHKQAPDHIDELIKAQLASQKEISKAIEGG